MPFPKKLKKFEKKAKPHKEDAKSMDEYVQKRNKKFKVRAGY